MHGNAAAQRTERVLIEISSLELTRGAEDLLAVFATYCSEIKKFGNSWRFVPLPEFSDGEKCAGAHVDYSFCLHELAQKKCVRFNAEAQSYRLTSLGRMTGAHLMEMVRASQ